MKAYFIQLMLKKGYLASNMFYAMHAHKQAHIRGYLQAADNAFNKIAQSIQEGDLTQKLAGEPSRVEFKRLT